jgi:hypothetical protein
LERNTRPLKDLLELERQPAISVFPVAAKARTDFPEEELKSFHCPMQGCI